MSGMERKAGDPSIGGIRKPSIKICGIRNIQTLLDMKGLHVTQVGFVFAPSKRRVTPEEAGELIVYLKQEGYQKEGLFRTAGVFVNPTVEELEQVLAAAPLDIVQLHGQETPEFCAQVRERFGVELFKAVTIPRGGAAAESIPVEELTAALEPYVPYVSTFLLDTFDPVAGGGSGKTFPWKVIPALRDWVREKNRRLLVAGGLHADNVVSLLQSYEPDGVDVSSGVETAGMKDAEKIRTFVERVHGA